MSSPVASEAVEERPRLALVLLAFAAVYVVWGSTYLGIRFAVETIPPFLMAGVRFLVAGALLYAWTALRGAPHPLAVHWRTALIVGGLLLLVGNGGVTWAEQTVPSGIAALLVATVPMWMVVLDWARPGGTRPGVAVWLGLAVGLAGVAVLVRPSATGGDAVDPAGAAAIGVATFAWALGSIYSRGAPRPASTLQLVAMQMLVAGAMLVAVGLALGEPVDVGAISARSAWALAYLIFVGALVGYTAYVWLLRVSTPARVSTYAYVNPIIAVLLGWALAGEALSARVALAAALVVGAVILVTTARR